MTLVLLVVGNTDRNKHAQEASVIVFLPKMAPLRPLPAKNALPSKSSLRKKEGSTATSNSSESLFATTKKDKRRIKHAQLISKVTKSKDTKQRRRRPSKKLVTTLDSLADALPDDLEDLNQSTDPAGSNAADQVNVIRRKSLKSKPGAMKRRQKLDNDERDRFGKNLAQMAALQPGAQAISSADKMKALRGFISQTLEKRSEVVGAGG